MKLKALILILTTLFLCSVVPANAYYCGGGYRGGYGYYGGGCYRGGYYGGWGWGGNYWAGAAVGAAIVGTAWAASYPYYYNTYPQPVYYTCPQPQPQVIVIQSR